MASRRCHGEAKDFAGVQLVLSITSDVIKGCTAQPNKHEVPKIDTSISQVGHRRLSPEKCRQQHKRPERGKGEERVESPCCRSTTNLSPSSINLTYSNRTQTRTDSTEAYCFFGLCKESQLAALLWWCDSTVHQYSAIEYK